MGDDFSISQVLFFAFVALCGLTVLSFLRVLSSFRQHQVDTHNAAREAKRLRRGYMAKLTEEKVQEVISV
jgi:hypothetical protein